MNFKKVIILGLSILTISQISYAGDKEEFHSDKQPKFLISIGKFFSEIGEKLNKGFSKITKPSSLKPSELQLLLSPNFKHSDAPKKELLISCAPSKEKTSKIIPPQISEIQKDSELKSIMGRTEINGQNIMNVSIYIIQNK